MSGLFDNLYVAEDTPQKKDESSQPNEAPAPSGSQEQNAEAEPSPQAEEAPA